MLKLKKCPKNHTSDLDKAYSPAYTVDNVINRLAHREVEILKDLERIDTGRLQIPVYISRAGSSAQNVLPTRKQMGKGSTPEQAKASALMELIERFSLFSFRNTPENFTSLSWKQAEKSFKEELIPISEILYSVREDLSLEKAREAMDLIEWDFCPALSLQEDRTYYLPFNWFQKLNEFNGSSAGNTFEESILQGGCELIERHVSAIVDRQELVLPTIDPNSFFHPTLIQLHKNFVQNNIELWIKDFTLDMGVPTVGALAYDRSTFPHLSEIVFTAGTATSPEKAAIRALTEIAQLAGDFVSGSNYDPSGLRKFRAIEETTWIKQGEKISLHSLPDISENDLLNEIYNLTSQLKAREFNLYTVDISEPNLNIPANYNIVPGFFFRERTPFASLGLFIGRILAEEYPVQEAKQKLDILGKIYPQKYFIHFFQGLTELRRENWDKAAELFQGAEPLQPSKEEQSLVAFYLAYSRTQTHKWDEALHHLHRAISLSKDNHAYHNLRGVTYFQLQEYSQAAQDFETALNIDRGSATDLANLGLCHKYMNNPDKARKLLKKSLEKDPCLDFAYNQLQELEKSN